MGGLYTPLESMPRWAQVLSEFNPVGYFIRVMRFIVIKGSGIRDLWQELRAMILFCSRIEYFRRVELQEESSLTVNIGPEAADA